MLFYGRITFLLFLSTTVHLKFQLFYNFFSQDQGSVPSLDFFLRCPQYSTAKHNKNCVNGGDQLLLLMFGDVKRNYKGECVQAVGAKISGIVLVDKHYLNNIYRS